MKESEDLESTRDFKTISGRVSDVRKRVSESGFERADALSKSFRMREFNAILGSCGVSRTALSFFQIHAGRCRFVLIRLGHSGFGGSQAGFWTVLGDVSSSATKEAKLVVKTALMFLWS